MADNAYDLCPREQRLRIAGALLQSAEDDLALDCDVLLMRLNDPLDLPDGVSFFSDKLHSDRNRRDALCRRAARAAMTVLIDDAGMQLPDNIGLAYVMPPKPEALAGEMARFIVDVAPEIENEAGLRAAADGVRPVDLNFVRPMRVLADRASAIVARIHAAGLGA